MVRKLVVQVAAAAVVAMLASGAADAQAVDPNKSFFGNFLFPKYFMPIFPLDGAALGGDLSATYDQAYIVNRPGLELLLVGEYPRARFFSISIYDDHGALIDTLHDAEINPLRPANQNPYRPGGPVGAEDMLYAVRVRLGEGFVTSPAAGCGFPGMDATSNVLDGRFRHTAGTRYSADMSNFTETSPDGTVTIAHDDSTQNKAVSIVVRRYLEATDANHGVLNLVRPVIFVRKSLDGCALDMWQLAGVPNSNPNAWLPPSAWYQFRTTADGAQIAAHTQHANNSPSATPNGLDPNNRFAWYAGPEYILTTNAYTGYLASNVPAAGKPAELNIKNKVLRMRFRVPAVPCRERTCALTDNEEMRYWGLSFVVGERTVVSSITDLDLNPDPDGYVTLIISFGTVLPAHVTAANGYSVVYLPASDIRLVTLRNLLPGADFSCSVNNVPFKTNEYNANGGYMGEYAPFVDFPFASALPSAAEPYYQAGTCVDALPVAADGPLTISTQGAAPGAGTAGSVDVATLATYAPGNTPSVVSITTDPANGTAGVSGTAITFTPDATFFTGTTTIGYTITDNDSDTDTGVITVTIPDLAPVLADGNLTTEQDTPSAALPLGVTPGNGAVEQHTLVISTAATNGTCELSGTSLTYTPAAGFFGADSCVVSLADGDGDEDPGTITITVSPVP